MLKKPIGCKRATDWTPADGRAPLCVIILTTDSFFSFLNESLGLNVSENKDFHHNLLACVCKTRFIQTQKSRSGDFY